MTRFVPRACRSLPTVAALALCLGHAHAQGINEPEVEKGQRKLESVHIIQNGFNGGLAGSTREVHSGAFTQGITDIGRSKASSPSTASTTRATRQSLAWLKTPSPSSMPRSRAGSALPGSPALPFPYRPRDECTHIRSDPAPGGGPHLAGRQPVPAGTSVGRNEEGTALLYAWQLQARGAQGPVPGPGGLRQASGGITGGDGAERHRIGPLGRRRVRRGREAHAEPRERLAVRGPSPKRRPTRRCGRRCR